MVGYVFDRVENIVGKGENAGYQQFLLFPQCFQKSDLLGSLKLRTLWERLNMQSRVFTTLKNEALENPVDRRLCLFTNHFIPFQR